MSVFSDMRMQLSRGGLAPYTAVSKFGFNGTVNTAYEPIWDGAAAYTFPTGPETVRVAAGGDANDTAAGSGARTIYVQGLDENWIEQTEEITLAGASASAATTTTFNRVYRAWVNTCGTYSGTNADDIVIENTTSTQTLAQISAGQGQTLMAIYTIPCGYTGYLVSYAVQPHRARDVSVRLVKRENANNTSSDIQAIRVVHRIAWCDEPSVHRYTTKLPSFPEKTDIWIEGLMNSGNGEVSAQFDLVLFRG